MKPLIICIATVLNLSIMLSSCFSPSKDSASNVSLSGTWKMTPETSTKAIGLISNDNPILFSFDLMPDSSAVLHFVDANGKLTKPGTWSTKKPVASLSKSPQTDMLIYYTDSTRVVAIGYQLEKIKEQTELVSLQMEHYQQGL